MILFLIIYYLIEDLRISLNNLIEKTLETENLSVCDPGLPSQPMSDSEIKEVHHQLDMSHQ